MEHAVDRPLGGKHDTARIALLASACVSASALSIWAFAPALQFLVQTWQTVGEYGYGYFVPPIVGFLVWQRRAELAIHVGHGAWSGLVLVAIGLLLNLVATFSAIRVFGQYGFVASLFGLAVCMLGWAGTRVIAVPLAFLCFMIPLPQFVLRELSEQLQLMSSQLGVAMMRALGISVFLEGNVIDLGVFRLQVVEACSGLRYLFPLLTLGALAAYFYKGSAWKRGVLVASTVPLTIVVNSLRIALIGYTVEHWGGAMAEGLLHDAEGLFMFLVCIALLAVEMALLARIGPHRDVPSPTLAYDLPAPAMPRSPALPMLASVALLLAFGLAAGRMTAHAAGAVPARAELARFPLELDGGWSGRGEPLDRPVLEALAVDDHLLANFSRSTEPPVNLFVAYYASQSGGESAHSPRTCIPGGGWQIVEIGDAVPQGAAWPVTRAVIARGEQRQLVYFWFAQRGRVLTSELAVKWYILRDALLRGRTDGALIRLVTPLPDGEAEGRADRRLSDFLKAAGPELAAYVPA